MKSIKLLLFAALAVYSFASCKNRPKLTASSSPVDSVSYAIGIYESLNTKDRITKSDINLNTDMFISGVYEVMHNDSVKMTREEALKIINDYITAEHKKKNVAFLEENKKKDSVTVTESGLQYKVISEGTGKSPEITDTVSVKYTGTLIDDNIFDTSRGVARKLSLSGVIRGWQEGLTMMKEGGRYIFYIPSELGYGDEPSGRIPPGSALIFDVELEEVIKPVN